MATQTRSQRPATLDAELERLLTRGGEGRPPAFAVQDIRVRIAQVPMRDGVRLATDLYLPPLETAPVIAMRTPYGRSVDRFVGTYLAFARRGYVVVAQDCRGTGDSEPDNWDYYVFESEDGYDLVEWISAQPWFGGFIGSCGASYAGQTQWPMAMHAAMSTIVPHVSGLGIAQNTTHLHMFANGYDRTVGKGEGKLDVHYSEIERLIEAETMATGYFNEPLDKPLTPALLVRHPQLASMAAEGARRWLWEHYASLCSADRADFVRRVMHVKQVSIIAIEKLSDLFGHSVPHDAHTIPTADSAALCRKILAPPLLFTGWYDWGLNDALATWEVMRREGRPEVAERMRLIVTPHAHNTLGYHEGVDRNAELQLMPGLANHAGVLLRWYQVVREQNFDTWPRVIYYLLGANEWRTAADWPPPEVRPLIFYFGSGGILSTEMPSPISEADRYVYDPLHPTPTVGGSIVSYLYQPGSVDVSEVQRRRDVLVYTTPPLERDLDVIGPLRVILYASSNAFDTDFVARLTDVFPDGRAIQLQSCVLRARYRESQPKLLEPGRIYRFEIDLWATANRFKAGHSLRVDISSADFPRFDRNANRGGKSGRPIAAQQSVYHDADHPSHLLIRTLS